MAFRWICGAQRGTFPSSCALRSDDTEAIESGNCSRVDGDRHADSRGSARLVPGCFGRSHRSAQGAEPRVIWEGLGRATQLHVVDDSATIGVPFAPHSAIREIGIKWCAWHASRRAGPRRSEVRWGESGSGLLTLRDRLDHHRGKCLLMTGKQYSAKLAPPCGSAHGGVFSCASVGRPSRCTRGKSRDVVGEEQPKGMWKRPLRSRAARGVDATRRA
jgi:hypothetical protein